MSEGAVETSTFLFELPWVLPLGALAVLLVLARGVWLDRRAGVKPRRIGVLVVLRLVGLVGLVLLLARPMSVLDRGGEARRSVAILLDHSASMALEDAALAEVGSSGRYARSLAWARDRLEPALRERGLRAEPYLFAEALVAVDDAAQLAASPEGERTDLAGAITDAVLGRTPPPAAVVAITDGVANVTERNRAAVAALTGVGVPVIGVAVGADREEDRISLDGLDAPSRAAPDQVFRLQARIQATTSSGLDGFELMLFRIEDDGERLVESRRIEGVRSSRVWTESFEVREKGDEAKGERTVRYRVALAESPGTRVLRRSARASVRITEEKELRVLFAQGALTWNYKFVRLALRDDPGLRLTGFSRTSEASVFRQNVETAGELLDGFPASLDALEPFRVVVLSELRPDDLPAASREALARFVGELGGGLLMIGGESTFDGSWSESRLEELLPVTFEPISGVLGLDESFHLALEPTAERHPVFQVAGPGDALDNAEIWRRLPSFVHHGKVRSAKPGAVIWATHSRASGLVGPRVLLASQSYGAGRSAVLALPNLWRWRLAREGEPTHFDRFWRQFLRYLAQSSGEEVTVQVGAGSRAPESDVELVIERRATPEAGDGGLAARVRVITPEGGVLHEQAATLEPLRPVALTVRPATEGVYTVSVRTAPADGEVGAPLATETFEILEVDRELERTARDLEALRQWAAISRGSAHRLEDVDEAEAVEVMIDEMVAAVEALAEERRLRVPLGLEPWGLLVLLAAFLAEWGLRKRWGLP